MRLAIIVSHPIQYYSPWFRHLAAAMGCTPRHEAIGKGREEGGMRRETGGKDEETNRPKDQETDGEPEVGGRDSLQDTSNSRQNALRVFYLWDFGVTEKTDKGFGTTVKWDVELLDGYDHEFVPNVSQRPGTDWFGGLDNPQLLQRVKNFAPDAVLQFGYNYKSLVNFDLRWNTKKAPLFFRGDSHLLAEDREQSRQTSVVSWQRERGEGQEAGVADKELKRRKDEETGKEAETKIREAMGMRREARGVRGEARGERLKRWMREIGLRLLFRRFACFLAVGKANADYFRAHGVPESKIVRCPHVVDNAFFLEEKTAGTRHEASGARQERRGLREELGIPEDELVFLFAGKLEEKKQPMQLLEAFLAADLPKATLVFVGSGELESALKERVALDQETKRLKDQKTAGRPDHGTNGLTTDEKTEDCKLHTANSRGNVRFLEFQNQSAMPAVYRTGDVLVLPSKGRYETWGLAVNEAACCGLPAIVSSHVGCGPDLIQDGITGWTFEAGNIEELKRCLGDAASNRHRLDEMGSTLQRTVLGDFSYEAATRALLGAMASRP